MQLIFAYTTVLPLHQWPRLTTVALLQEALALAVLDTQAQLGSQVRTKRVLPCSPRLTSLRHHLSISPCWPLSSCLFKSWDLSRPLNEVKADYV